MTKIVMPTRPDCVGYAEIKNADVRAGTTEWDAILRQAAHAALCVWADHPNRRFYAPSTISWQTSPDEQFTRDVITLKVSYNLEPMMDRIIAEQEEIQQELEKHRQMAEKARQLHGNTVPGLDAEVFRRIEGGGG